MNLSKRKAFADDKINVTQTLKYVFGRIENSVEKGENTVYQNFLLSHSVFKIFLYQGLPCKEIWSDLPIPTQGDLLTPLGNKPFVNTVGKGEIARYEQFLLFPQCFLSVWITFCHFRQI